MSEKCKCGQRNADQCDEEFGPDCDLGNNGVYASVSQDAERAFQKLGVTLTRSMNKRIQDLEAQVRELEKHAASVATTAYVRGFEDGKRAAIADAWEDKS